MAWRIIARLRYDDRSSDVVEDVETEQEARQYLSGHGFKETGREGHITYWALPTLDNRNRPTDLIAYLIDRR